MDSGKQQQEQDQDQDQGGSETSSEENEEEGSMELQQVKHRRCYECAFCKRGFTNAQALGGHMNIHRKDRVSKAKHQTPYVHTKHAPGITTHHSSSTHLPSAMEHSHPRISSNYNMYSSGSSSNSFFGGPHHSFSSSSMSTTTSHAHPSAALNMNPELVGANLSLRINLDGGDHNDVDLELRLGHG